MNASDFQIFESVAQVGESPVWHPQELALYYCDIPGQRLCRLDPVTGDFQDWTFDSEVACCALIGTGELLLALRSGLWRFNPATNERQALITPPPYDPDIERFNDGKCDPQGRFWIGTLYEPRKPALAALYRFHHGDLTRMAEGVTNSNGLAWSPDGRTMYWSDTTSHTIFALDFDEHTGQIGSRRVFAQFPAKEADQSLSTYGGRPDGGAVDAEGCYWAAMFEGARLVRISPQGKVLQDLKLPVQCPTMPCFGGVDLKTLFITTARKGRSAEELSAQPHAGKILALTVEVPGAPIPMFRG